MLLLSRDPGAQGAQELLAAAQRLEIELLTIDPHRLELHQRGTARELVYEGAALDVRGRPVIPRLSGLASEFSLLALRQLELCGARPLNSAAGIARLRLKFQSLQELAEVGLAVPESIALRSPADLAQAAERLGGWPLILKYMRGNQGLGVILAEHISAAASILEALNLLNYDLILQRFYPRGAQEDTRIVTLGGTARWAVRRSTAPDGFRSNFHRGGSFEAVELDSRKAALAEAASRVFGLGLAGVDIIEDDDDRPLVLEVNSSPGFATVGGAYGSGVAEEVLRHALELARALS